MYFYTLSDGCYSDYGEVTLYHETKWTKEQFGEMFNKAIEHGYGNKSEVANYLFNNFGFKKVESEIHVRCDYGRYKNLTPVDYEGSNPEIDAEDKG